MTKAYFFTALLARSISKFRENAARRTDDRVRLMNEIVTGIKVIKMYTWEKPFANLISTSRELELKEIRGASYLKAILMSFAMYITRFSTFISILTFVLMDNNPNAYYVFVVTCFYNSLRVVISNQLPEGMALLAELNISIKRLQSFLEYEEKEERGKKENDSNVLKEENRTIQLITQKGVYIKNATAKWNHSISDNTLSNINVEFLEKQLVAVVGSVGCGKTSLFQVILKELPLVEGSIETNGIISYCAQDPWLFCGSVRQNILFGQPLDSGRYDKVVKVCALERDFLILPIGDRSVVGDRGVLLSGGQKARIGLARTVYKEADIYLLDDPLSAVDTNVGRQLFENCINGFLKGKCVILATHQLQYLANVDNIIVFKNGNLVATGPYKDLQKEGYFGNLMFAESEEENEVKENYNKSDEVVTYDMVEINRYAKELEEHRSTGKVDTKVYCTYLKAGEKLHFAFFAFTAFLLAQIAANGADYFITFW